MRLEIKDGVNCANLAEEDRLLNHTPKIINVYQFKIYKFIQTPIHINERGSYGQVAMLVPTYDTATRVSFGIDNFVPQLLIVTQEGEL